jgi:hypothetical protein
MLARTGAAPLADDEGVDSEDSERTGHRDDGDHRAGLPAPARLEQSHAGDEATPAQQPAPRHARSGCGDVCQQQTGEQRQECRPSKGEGPPQASRGEGENAGPHPCDQERVERTERPPSGRNPSAPHQAVQWLAGDAYGGHHRRQHHGHHRKEDRRREAGTRLERCRSGQQRPRQCPTEKRGSRTRHDTQQKDGEQLHQQEADRSGGPPAAEPRDGDLPAPLLGRGCEHEPEDEHRQHGHRRHQQRNGAVRLAGLRANSVRDGIEVGVDVEVPAPAPDVL